VFFLQHEAVNNYSPGGDASSIFDRKEAGVSIASYRSLHPTTPQQATEVVGVDSNPTTQRDRGAETVRCDSVEYDPSIWDFLSPALSRDDDDDENRNGNGEGSSDGDTEEESARSSAHQVNSDRSAEHGQAVMEIVDTEVSYGKDLDTIKHVRIRELSRQRWTKLFVPFILSRLIRSNDFYLFLL